MGTRCEVETLGRDIFKKHASLAQSGQSARFTPDGSGVRIPREAQTYHNIMVQNLRVKCYGRTSPCHGESRGSIPRIRSWVVAGSFPVTILRKKFASVYPHATNV